MSLTHELLKPLITIKQSIVTCAILYLCLIAVSCIPEKHPIPKARITTAALSTKTLDTWRNQKFSMFIHFGLYSLPAGVWNGKQVTKGYSEQIRAHGRISKLDYRRLAENFNPVKWNPDSIVLLAKAAGMQSIVITAKHHDGFALFKTKFSKFNIVDSTPYQKDLLFQLSEACKKHGLKFGVYFSLIDWDFEGALPPSDHNSDSIPPAHHQMNLGQLEELLTGYGTISEIWFDMGKPTKAQSLEMARIVRELQPECLISGRIWNDQGDFAVMGDNASPDFRMGQPWQTPASMFNETWGYRSWQVRKDATAKANEKIKSLIRTVANGGNYLLNIGPAGDGSVIPFEREVLLKIGKWISAHQEELVSSKPITNNSQSWGFITASEKKLHLFILNKPAGQTITVKGLRSKIESIYMDGKSDSLARIKSVPAGTEISFTKGALRKETIPVITLQLKEAAIIESEKLIDYKSGKSIQLDQKNSIAYHSYSGSDYYSTKPTIIRLEWDVRTDSARRMDISFSIPDKHSVNKYSLTLNGKVLNAEPADKTLSTGVSVIQFKGPFQKGINNLNLRLSDQGNPHQHIGLNNFSIILQ